MDYQALMRHKLLEQMYDKMSDEEKRLFVQMTLQNKDHNEIMETLQRNENHIENILEKVPKQTWLSDFSSNIVGNAVWDGLIWLGGKLFKR